MQVAPPCCPTQTQGFKYKPHPAHLDVACDDSTCKIGAVLECIGGKLWKVYVRVGIWVWMCACGYMRVWVSVWLKLWYHALQVPYSQHHSTL